MIRKQIPDFDIKKIAESGQCFRIIPVNDGFWRVVAGNNCMTVRAADIGEISGLEPSGPESPSAGSLGVEAPSGKARGAESAAANGEVYDFSCSEAEFEGFWRNYFDLDEDYGRFALEIPKSDDFLRSAAEYGRGIRILRQDAWEMLITFIISQRKSIPAIRKCVEALCDRFGEPAVQSDMWQLGAVEQFGIGQTGAVQSNAGKPDVTGQSGVRLFPTPEALARQPESELAACGLGYRTPYIAAASKLVADGEFDLAALAVAENEELLAQLLRIHGVGPKVASCVMLFGFHRLDAFPVDVWVEKALSRYYPNGFPAELYEGFAGIMQQYIFHYIREQ